MTMISERAPAKINLRLDVLGLREDGFHEIDTVMQTVSLADELEFTPAGGRGEVSLGVRGGGEDVPHGDDNLVLRAARLLMERFGGGREGVRIELTKRIPAGAGLGGGSSDAAAALRGLSKYWGIGAGLETLTSLAAKLGSDVPFFIVGGAARCRGRGEIVEPVQTMGKLHLVLCWSGFLSTPKVYKMWDELSLTGGPSNGIVVNGEGLLDFSALHGARLWNALESAALAVEPGLAEVKRALTEAGAGTAMVSGSGSCIFGTAGSRADAEAIAARFAAATGRETIVSETVGCP